MKTLRSTPLRDSGPAGGEGGSVNDSYGIFRNNKVEFGERLHSQKDAGAFGGILTTGLVRSSGFHLLHFERKMEAFISDERNHERVCFRDSTRSDFLRQHSHHAESLCATVDSLRSDWRIMAEASQFSSSDLPRDRRSGRSRSLSLLPPYHGSLHSVSLYLPASSFIFTPPICPCLCPCSLIFLFSYCSICLIRAPSSM